jgi:hypothetical protein
MSTKNAQTSLKKPIVNELFQNYNSRTGRPKRKSPSPPPQKVQQFKKPSNQTAYAPPTKSST